MTQSYAVRSMTAFARSETILEGSVLSLEIKSVNHRYLDQRWRLPAALAPLEAALGPRVKARLHRGSVELVLRQNPLGTQPLIQGTTRYVVDEAAARSLKTAAGWLQRHVGVTPFITFGDALAAGRVIVAVEESVDVERLTPAIVALLDSALDSLVAERSREGQQTAQHLAELLTELERFIDLCQRLAPVYPDQIRQRLQRRLEQWKLTNVDASRLEQEVVHFADRADISEEIQRLLTHTAACRALLVSPPPVGRQLEFLIQEMHRETNTLATKAQGLEIAQSAIVAKSVLEKLREQIQNVE